MKIKFLNIFVILAIILVYTACQEARTQKISTQVNNIVIENGTGEVDGYKLKWEDHFNDGELNTDYWTIEVNGDGGGNNELQYYREENIAVGTDSATNAGCLIITARKEDYQGKTCTSGRLTTHDKVTVHYGKIEARIKLPKTADGLWPAFWMMGNDISEVGWPKCGETDILEMGHANGIKNGTQDRYFNGACHWGENWRVHRYFDMDKTNKYGIQDGFHLYTVEWDSDSIKMFLDKDKYPDVEPYFVMDIADKTPRSAGSYFHKPNFILLNLAVGGNFPEIWDIDKITALKGGEANMYVDFVKVYQKEI